ncbi:unnamed protein product [Penicillium pancosmium]
MVLIAKLLVLALTAAATPIFRRDAVTVENDITQKIGPQIQTLDSDVNGFPASGSSGALAIHNDLQSLVPLVDGATSDIKLTGSFSEADGATILEEVQSLTSKLLASDWENITGGQARVSSDLQSLNKSFDGFTNALVIAETLLQAPSVLGVRIQIGSAFADAIAAYSN